MCVSRTVLWFESLLEFVFEIWPDVKFWKIMVFDDDDDDLFYKLIKIILTL